MILIFVTEEDTNKKMYLDAELYESTEPLNSVIRFLTVTLKDLGWNDGKEHLVMDVGCGPGNVTVNWILPLFPNLKKMIALDYLPSMIELAKTKNFHPKTEYHVADFEDGSTTEIWKGQVTKLISIHCFNWFKNQEKALQIVHDLLQPGGEVALYFVVQSDYYDAVLDLTNNSKWKNLFEDKFKDHFMEDYVRDFQRHYPDAKINDHLENFSNHVLFALQDVLLSIGGNTPLHYGLPSPQAIDGIVENLNREYFEHTNFDRVEIQHMINQNEPKLNNEQNQIYRLFTVSVNAKAVVCIFRRSRRYWQDFFDKSFTGQNTFKKRLP
ncbi:methyltransf_25 domain-containing protein [Trichonephila clavipes]|nr:methyltransf_25 domain-containing protein [Trichonephila clavipes]